MAKKVRATSSTYRPGGQGPTHASKSASAPAGSTADARSASPGSDIDAALDAVAQQSGELTISPSTTTSSVARRSRRGAKARSDSLHAQAAAESVYVREDLRTIAMINGVLIIGLIVAWVLFVPLNLLGLY